MRIALVHGFNVWDGGEASLGDWDSALHTAGHNTWLIDYGWTGLLRVRLENMNVVDSLERYRPDVIIGHSNGAAIAWQYAQTGAPLAGVVCVQPALNTETVWPANVGRIVCLYNGDDWAVLAGKVWRLLNPVSWFRRHPWGAAGRYGFERADRRFDLDRRFRQFDTARDPHHPYCGHSISHLSRDGAHYWARRAFNEVTQTCET